MDILKAERWLQPFVREHVQNPALPQPLSGDSRKTTIYQRHEFARKETVAILGRVWKWVIIGVGIGAALHGFVPDAWFARPFGSG